MQDTPLFELPQVLICLLLQLCEVAVVAQEVEQVELFSGSK